MTRLFMLFLGVTVILAGCDSSSLSSGYCSLLANEPATIKVATTEYSVTLVNDKPSSYLGAMLEDGSAAERRSHTLGLTSVELGHQTNVRTSQVVPGFGFVCAVPSFEVELQVKNFSVDVARELPPGTCAYDVVLAHELEHVRIHEEHLALAKANLVKELSDRLAQQPILYAESSEELEIKMHSLIEKWVDPVLQAVLEQQKTAQAAFDSPKEYERIAAACL